MSRVSILFFIISLFSFYSCDDNHAERSPSLESVFIIPSSIVITDDDKEVELYYQVTPDNYIPKKVEWSIQYDSIAVIDNNIITGRSNGQTKLYLSIDGIVSSCDVIVSSSTFPPLPISVIDVKPICGGADITIDYPDDETIKGAFMEYTRNGLVVRTKISKFSHVLRAEGFADCMEHCVQIGSFNKNELVSSMTAVLFNPLPPAIKTTHVSLYPTFGGISVSVDGNDSNADLAITILCSKHLEDSLKAPSKVRWLEVTTLFTSADKIVLTRRGIEQTKQVFGCYLRDRWGNISDTLSTVLTPLEEVQLSTSTFQPAALKDDNCYSYGQSYPIQALWDGSNVSSVPHYFCSSEVSFPCWLTIDIGRKIVISRIKTLPRDNYQVFSGPNPRNIELWGSLSPTGEKGNNEHGFDDTWFCLGKFTQNKPSGYNEDGSVGGITSEDRIVFNSGNVYDLDDDAYPNCHHSIRFLRLVFTSTFDSYGKDNYKGIVMLGEITLWGQYQ